MTKENIKTKELNIMNDAMFKALFRSVEARSIISTFLSSVTGIKKEVLIMLNM